MRAHRRGVPAAGGNPESGRGIAQVQTLACLDPERSGRCQQQLMPRVCVHGIAHVPRVVGDGERRQQWTFDTEAGDCGAGLPRGQASGHWPMNDKI